MYNDTIMIDGICEPFISSSIDLYYTFVYNYLYRLSCCCLSGNASFNDLSMCYVVAF
jgi:hypothetical protein